MGCYFLGDQGGVNILRLNLATGKIYGFDIWGSWLEFSPDEQYVAFVQHGGLELHLLTSD